MVGTVKKFDRYHGLEVILQEGRQVCDGGLRPRHILANTGLADVDAELKQFAVDPRRAPQHFSRSSSESVSVFHGRQAPVPAGRGAVQTTRNPLRCQAITVSGFTMTGADRQPVQNRDNRAQRNRSAAVSFGPLHRALQNVELMAKSEHLNLKGGPSANAITHCCLNGH